ncbi:peptidoglycan-binding protein [Pseudomonas sp. SDI]|uniref:FimV/HubP family polar landmark protein n=1 Tax=Pseudomonas sp. SDI TaxID=2170734 RepID=UPI000DE715C9|nr:FimV/HubP family polar landmark protein [Pseudomonas sp. SDI]PWB31531.1 peptidoglycan-binding protein [Pseudomonas sp. SDI]
MLRIRKLVLAIAAASALSSGMAHALGLGELTLKSAQNQPLEAEIELLDVNGLSAAEVLPSLAPADEFSKAGVERQAYLNDLRFTPVINPGGKSVLRVTSSQPLPAPMVKFLVQVMWPQGRLLRDYSVLVDPSKFSPEAAKAAAAVSPAVTAPAQYTTVRRDTLWEIASRARQGGGSVQQTMLAIQALNPDAFINGNINQLKTGQVLRLPDQQQIQSTPQPQAVKEVAAQYAAWREGRRLGPRARQLDATRRAGTEAAPARIAQQDNLRLVSPGGKGAAGDKALADKLATTQESLDSSRREGDELKSRVSDLQSQLDKLQKLIALKNDQLARLEAQSAQPAAPAAALPGAAPAINAQLQPAPTPVDTVVSPAPAAVDTAPPAEAPVADAAATPDADQSSASALDDLLGNPLLLALIGASALLVLLLLLLLLARKRKAQQEAEKHMRMARALAEESDLGPDLDLPQSSFEGLEVAPPTVILAPAVVAASAAAASAAEVPDAAAKLQPAPEPLVVAAPEPVVVAEPVAAPSAEPVVADTSFAQPVVAASAADAILTEAEMAIARGRLNHAAELLEPAVAQSPERSDLRLKLMEVYARQGDRDAFTGHERQLIATGQNHADVEALKSRFPAMAAVVTAGIAGAAMLASALDADAVQALLAEEPQAPALDLELPAEADLDDAFDLSLDDLDGLEDLQPQALAEPEPQEIGVQPEPAVAEVGEPAALDDLDFDSLFEEHAPAAAEPVAEPVAEVPEVAVEVPVEPVPTPMPSLDDLADFDLDVGGDAAQLPASEPLDIEAELAAFDRDLGLEADLPELDLPEDFDLSLADETLSEADARFASELDDVNAELDKLSVSLEQPPIEAHFTAEDAKLADFDDLDMGDDFDFMNGTDVSATNLDLARAYIDMGDHDGARDILQEVVKDGTAEQKQEAEDMLNKLV